MKTGARAAAVLLVTAGALFGSARFLIRPAVAQSADAAVETVRRADVVRTVACTGRIVPNRDVDIKCRASGEIKSLPFDVSDAVKAGDLLLELDPLDQERVARKAEVAVEQSRARLELARRNRLLAEVDAATTRKRADAQIRSAEVKTRTASAKQRRRERLLREGMAAPEDVEVSQSDTAAANAELDTSRVAAEEVKEKEITMEVRRDEVNVARAQLDADQIALDDARQQLAYTRVVSPMNGVITSRSVQTGTIISSGITNVGGGTTVLTVSDVSRLFVVASVDEADIGQVVVGQAAELTVDAFPGERFAGQVCRIASKGQNVSNVVSFEVRVEVTGANRRLLKPEMTASVRIICQERKRVIAVPVLAVTRRGKECMVNALDAHAAPVERAVVVGLSDGETSEICEGLAEGDRILVPREIPSKFSNEQKPAGPPPPMM